MENKPVTLFDRIFYTVASLISAHLLFYAIAHEIYRSKIALFVLLTVNALSFLLNTIKCWRIYFRQRNNQE